MKKYRLLWILTLILGLTIGSVGAQTDSAGGTIALTFDDGPSGAITRRLLEGLEQRGVKATFFLCGYRLEQYPNIAPLLVAGGHELGLHGYSHQMMNTMTEAQLRQELEQTTALIQEQTGVTPTLLRPPGGQTNDQLQQVARDMGLTLVFWNVDPKDWVDQNKERILKNLLKDARDGAVILLHDMWHSSVDATLEAIDRLQQQGYEFVTVSQLLEDT